MSVGERVSVWRYGLVCVCIYIYIAHSPYSPSRVIRQFVRLGHCADASSGASRQPHGEVGG